MIAPRPDLRIPSRRACPRVTGIAAPEEGFSSRLTSGAAAFFTDEGDLIAVPPFERVAGNRFSACARACVSMREGVPSDALPRAPP